MTDQILMPNVPNTIEIDYEEPAWNPDEFKVPDVGGADVKVHEPLRRIVSRDGAEIKLTNVTSFNNTGAWLRMECDQGYVIANPANILAIIVKGERVV